MLQTLPHARHLLPNPLGLSTGSHKEGEGHHQIDGSVSRQSVHVHEQTGHCAFRSAPLWRALGGPSQSHGSRWSQ